MKLTRFIAGSVGLALCVLAPLAAAGDIAKYSQARFDQLTQGGKPVLLFVQAGWCPTCKAQKPIIEGLMKQDAYKSVTTLTIDFDTEKALLRKYKVDIQSTLIGFKGKTEVGYLIGDTTHDGIEGLVKKTLN